MPTTIPVSMMSPKKPPRRIDGARVLLMFCGFFGVIFTMNAVFVYFAFSTFGGVDAAGAYRKNFLLTKDIAAASKQNDLGWAVTGTINRTQKNSALIKLTVKDRNNQPVKVRSAKVEMRRPTDKRLDAIVAMKRTGPNSFNGNITGAGAGQWDTFVTIVSQRGERFHSRNRIVLK